jgi:putative FmdB family regulatory protein
MPTYEYVCEKCGRDFEKIQSIKDGPLKVCPRELCGKKQWGRGRVKRKIGAGAGLLFKGRGFYITDYRSKNYKESAKKDSAPAKPPVAKPETKSTPTKPAAKAEK